MNLKSWIEAVKHPFRTVYRVISEFLGDDGPFIAAGIAFYAFFSLFPLVLISVAILSYVYTPEEAITGAISLASLFVPRDMSSFLESNVRELFKSAWPVSLSCYGPGDSSFEPWNSHSIGPGTSRSIATGWSEICWP